MGKRSYREIRLDQLQKWNETNFKYIDVIVSSGEIRQLFFQRCKQLKLDPYRVCIAAGLNPKSFKDNYVNNPLPNCTKSFNQEKFIVMLEIVGIDIKVLVKMKPFSEVYVRLQEKGLIKSDERKD